MDNDPAAQDVEILGTTALGKRAERLWRGMK